jgi:hypothetical protein
LIDIRFAFGPLTYNVLFFSTCSRLAASTKSLNKFFTEGVGDREAEGRGFFDEFTAAEGEEEPGDLPPGSERNSLTGIVLYCQNFYRA